MRRRFRHGFTLIETLVVVAIIAILMALYLPTLSRALSKAKDVKHKEGLRQNFIGMMADGANSPDSPPPRSSQYECRKAYRQDYEDSYVTQPLYIVHNEAEFVAYWYTMIRADAPAPEYTNGGRLIARDTVGNKYLLAPLDLNHLTEAPFPMAWEFISTNLNETADGNLGTNVLYGDGHADYVRYPGPFPMTPFVAELSHRYMVE